MRKSPLTLQYFKNNCVVIDTNILLLLFIGTYDKHLITTFKRTKQYTEDDYDILQTSLEGKTLVTTPNILTEISNFAFQLKLQITTFKQRFLHFVACRSHLIRHFSKVTLSNKI